eukprot:809159_1
MTDSSLLLPQLVQTSQLEGILQNLLSKVNSQDVQIARLTDELSTRATNDQVEALQKSLEQVVEVVEKRFASLETSVELIAPKLDVINEHTLKLEHVSDELKVKVPRYEYDKEINTTKQSFADLILELSSTKADIQTVSNLEKSQRCLSKNIASLEGVLACKLDKVELPFLESSSHRLQELSDARESFDRQLHDLQGRMGELSATMQEKEDKATNVRRMQSIHDQLQSKVDTNLVDSQIRKPIQILQNNVKEIETTLLNACSPSESIHAARDSSAKLEPQALADRFRNIQVFVDTLKKHTDAMDATMRSVQKQVNSRASERSLDLKADRAYCAQRADECEGRVSKAELENERTATELRRSIRELKHSYSGAQAKLRVVCKFIDWFADIKLRGIGGQPEGGGGLKEFRSLYDFDSATDRDLNCRNKSEMPGEDSPDSSGDTGVGDAKPE